MPISAVVESKTNKPRPNPLGSTQVRLDPEVHTVVWPTGADFDPAILHDWPEHEAAFRAAIKNSINLHYLSALYSKSSIITFPDPLTYTPTFKDTNPPRLL